MKIPTIKEKDYCNLIKIVMWKYLFILFCLTSIILVSNAQDTVVSKHQGSGTMNLDSVVPTRDHIKIYKRIDSLKTDLDSILQLKDNPNNKINYKMDVLNNIIAPLLVALLSGLFTWLWTKRKIEKKVDAAPRKYIEELDKLIKIAVAEGVNNAIINARAIVAARNSLRNSLVGISSQLNSEIDRLATEIGESNTNPKEASSKVNNTPQIEAKSTYETILVLSKIWPSKKEQIEVELRKLLAELGLTSTKL